MPYCSPVGITCTISRAPSEPLTSSWETGRSLMMASIWPLLSAAKASSMVSKVRISPVMSPCSSNSLALISPVVPIWTPTVASPISSVDPIPESLGTSRDWSALKYGSEKSMRFWRSGVMVMAEITAPYWLFARRRLRARRRPGVEGRVGEVYALLALGRDGHGGDHGVVLVVCEAAYDAVEADVLVLGLEARALADLVHEIG